MSLALIQTEPAPGASPEPEAGPTFEDFWTLCPKKVAKKDARIEWGKLTPANQLKATVAMFSWRRVWDDERFIPYPSTWLHGERFDDELPPSFTQTSGSHVPATLPDLPERTAMPDHVKAAIARLRK